MLKTGRLYVTKIFYSEIIIKKIPGKQCLPGIDILKKYELLGSNPSKCVIAFRYYDTLRDPF